MVAIFREYTLEDAKPLARLANNKKIWRNVRDGFPHPYTFLDAISFLNYSITLSPPLNYAIELEGQFAGGIGIVPKTDVERISAEIGYWLGEEYWNRGIATAVVRSFSDFILNDRDINHLYAGVFSYNQPSMRVLEKAGFRSAGIMHGCAVKDGEVIDMHYYEKYRGMP